jgi:hypothetical protein
MTFRAWLRQQRRRDDAVGDLAHLVELDPCRPRSFSPGSVHAHLVAVHHASGAAVIALGRAAAEWEQAEAERKAPRIWMKEGRLGVTLGDPRVWECEQGQRLIQAMRETAELERMWEGSPDA